MEIGPALMGGVVTTAGAVLPVLLSYRGFSFHRTGSRSLLELILKVSATCLYLISAWISSEFMTLGISILNPRIGGALATAQRLLAWHGPTFLIGIGCAVAAECLNWAGNKISTQYISQSKTL